MKWHRIIAGGTTVFRGQSQWGWELCLASSWLNKYVTFVSAQTRMIKLQASTSRKGAISRNNICTRFLVMFDRIYSSNTVSAYIMIMHEPIHKQLKIVKPQYTTIIHFKLPFSARFILAFLNHLVYMMFNLLLFHILTSYFCSSVAHLAQNKIYQHILFIERIFKELSNKNMPRKCGHSFEDIELYQYKFVLPGFLGVWKPTCF